MIHRKESVSILVFVVLMVITVSWNASAGVNLEVVHTLNLEHSPLKLATSPDGKHLFVLTNAGDIVVYDRDGVLQNRIHIGDGLDQIRVDPAGNRLFVSSAEKKKVQIIDLDFYVDIRTSGAPFKGAPDAPIVLAVFSDFQ